MFPLYRAPWAPRRLAVIIPHVPVPDQAPPIAPRQSPFWNPRPSKIKPSDNREMFSVTTRRASLFAPQEGQGIPGLETAKEKGLHYCRGLRSWFRNRFSPKPGPRIAPLGRYIAALPLFAVCDFGSSKPRAPPPWASAGYTTSFGRRPEQPHFELFPTTDVNHSSTTPADAFGNPGEALSVLTGAEAESSGAPLVESPPSLNRFLSNLHRKQNLLPPLRPP